MINCARPSGGYRKAKIGAELPEAATQCSSDFRLEHIRLEGRRRDHDIAASGNSSRVYGRIPQLRASAPQWVKHKSAASGSAKSMPSRIAAKIEAPCRDVQPAHPQSRPTHGAKRPEAFHLSNRVFTERSGVRPGMAVPICQGRRSCTSMERERPTALLIIC